jgi:glycosyltransferase involved in cell wall biosynthesis
MKSVIILANSTHGGGAENTMMNLHRELPKFGIDSIFCAINNMESCEHIQDSRVLYIHRNWSTGFYGTFKSLQRFRLEMRMRNPDLMIINCELPELFVALTPLKSCKLIVVEHTSQPWKGRRLLGVVVRAILRLKRVKWVTVNSEELRIWPMMSLATHLPNPVITSRHSDPITTSSDIVFLGRLRAEKCPEMVIEASIECSSTVYLFGDGTLMEYLKTKYDSNEFVNFLGFMKDPWTIISPQSLVVVPSEYEGDGLVVLEAIQNGNPVLLRNNQDLKRFQLKDENYFLDKSELILRINEHKAKPGSFAIDPGKSAKILASRSIDLISKRWSDLIEQIIEG